MAGENEAWWAKLIPKQGTGVLGRLSTVAMVMLVVMGVGIYGIDGAKEKDLAIWLKFAGVIAVAGVGLYFLHRLLDYAVKNPLHASLEGSELVTVQMRQWEIAEKGQVPALPSGNVPPPPKPEAPKEGAPQ